MIECDSIGGEKLLQIGAEGWCLAGRCRNLSFSTESCKAKSNALISKESVFLFTLVCGGDWVSPNNTLKCRTLSASLFKFWNRGQGHCASCHELRWSNDHIIYIQNTFLHSNLAQDRIGQKYPRYEKSPKSMKLRGLVGGFHKFESIVPNFPVFFVGGFHKRLYFEGAHILKPWRRG